MKNKNPLIVILSLLFTILFFNQNNGVNFTIFTFVLTLAFGISQPEKLKEKNWLFMAFLTVLSGISVGVYGNALSLISNCVSILVLAANTYLNHVSVPFALLQSISSLVLNPVFWMAKRFGLNLKPETEKPQSKRFKNWALFIFPVLLTLLFLSLYRESNVLFKDLTDNINLDFISLAWIRFFIFGLLIISGIIAFKPIDEVDMAEKNLQDIITPSEAKTFQILGMTIDLKTENTIGIISFSMLNILLLISNLLDFNFLLISKNLPIGITLSDYLHQGINSLIFSIILAILLIVWLFRGELNFFTKNEFVKTLAYLWILQNIAMIFANVLKNDLYISAYSLTYKRIGVFVYLLLCALGLSLTIIKIWGKKSNWFLVKNNFLGFYFILILSAFFNWDGLITHFNLNKKNSLKPDYAYLLKLTPISLAELAPINNKIEEENLEFYSQELLSFAHKMSVQNLQSNNWVENKVFKKITESNNNKLIESFELNNPELDQLPQLSVFSNLKNLEVKNRTLNNLSFLSKNEGLEHLTLNNTLGYQKMVLPHLPHLQKLSLKENNNFQMFFEQNMPELESLQIIYCSDFMITANQKLSNLKQLEIQHSSSKNFRFLNANSHLTSIFLNSVNADVIDHLRQNHQLEKISIINMNLDNKQKVLNHIFQKNQKLESLSMAKCAVNPKGFENLNINFQYLKKLDLSNNNLSYLPSNIFNAQIEEMDLSFNDLKSLEGLASLQKLKRLKISFLKNVCDNLASHLPKNIEVLEIQNLDSYFDFSSLKNFEKLTELHFNESSISNDTWEKLILLQNIRVLDLRQCQNISIDHLQKMKNLQKIIINANHPDLLEIKKVFNEKITEI